MLYVIPGRCVAWVGSTNMLLYVSHTLSAWVRNALITVSLVVVSTSYYVYMECDGADTFRDTF